MSDQITPSGGIDSTQTFEAYSEKPEGVLNPLTGLSAEETEVLGSLAAEDALLIVRQGANLGSRFLLDADETLAGRSPKADIFLDDVTVSRKHAIFKRELAEFVVRDAGSLNGTYVNRNRVDSAVLRHGDEVQVGKFRMIYYRRLDQQ